jgi:hypothetical protein
MTISYIKEDFHAYKEKDRKRRKAIIRMYDPTLEGKLLKVPVPY